MEIVASPKHITNREMVWYSSLESDKSVFKS